MDNVVPSATPYAADFPGAAYAQTFNYADSSSSFVIYQYFKLSSDSLFGIGSAEHFHYSYHGYVHDTVYIYDTTEFYAHFPVQLGNNSGGSADTANFGGGSLEVTTSTNTIDAFGTLILPIGSFQALRQSTKAVHNFYYNSSLVNSYTSYSFTWFTREGHKLEVETDTAKSGTVNLTSLSVTYSETTPVSAVRTHREAPSGFALEQNYPNPFNPTTAIRFRTSEISHVTLAVYNLLGDKVATLVNEEKSPGTYQVQFDGSRLSSGVYFYTLRSGNYTATKRLLLMK
ncbi:MAG: T9SS type A sorting domain-containing protein [Bacteroidota bacterium]|nr:T9SS type A sorting domain-containing protein [Bacteroidota bacterium]